MMEQKKKWSYYFGEGRKEDKFLLGGKGANLSEMVRLGLPIPLGFTITSEACIYFQKNKQWPPGLREQIDEHLARLEKDTGQKLGNLLLSVRSGAAVSMPGMMDTVLNLGLNDTNTDKLARKSNNPRFAMDCFRRFVMMFADVVKEIPKKRYGRALDAMKEKVGATHDTELTAAHLKTLVDDFRNIYRSETGESFPTDPRTQLDMSIDAVFSSWNNPRAIVYRDLNEIPHDMGTAVNVQAMVFGNLGETSGTGVAFTRNPSTGDNHRYGEYLMNAQGEDVVAGVRTPQTLKQMKTLIPHVHSQLLDIFDKLEAHYHDMQDIEFTIQDMKLYILQTRNGKRTAPAAVKMAVDMVREGLITKEQAVTRVSCKQLEQLLHKTLDPKAEMKAKKLAQGLPASPGAAVGRVAFSAEKATEMSADGTPVVLVRLETSPDDIQGMHVSQGILTARGGMTSHAAVVARGMNRCCVAGVKALTVDEDTHTATIDMSAVGQSGVVHLKEGDWLSLNGSKGIVYAGQLGVITPKLKGEFGQLLNIADQVRNMQVFANADTPADAKVALDFGAEGIGLVRTEHMFFGDGRISAVREMIVANNTVGRERALAKLLPFQRDDFYGILKVMSGKPVVIRLIDPPLHEFLPHASDAKEMGALAKELRMSVTALTSKVESLKEFNPMLGFRGVRLGVVYPEINAMQARAIFEASMQLKREGFDPRPKIEIPLVGKLEEYMAVKKIIQDVAIKVGAANMMQYEIGTMIEVPRAALTADELATEAEFMSFGTNDLTQMTCGFSRDDAASFLGDYVKQGIYPRDPFQSIDARGVGKLMNLCVQLARSTRPNIDIGICGEHGGDPHSIEVCQRIGLNNVSCSPYRVPVARLAAAQAYVKYKHAKNIFFLSKL